MSYILPILLLFAPAMVWAETNHDSKSDYCNEIASVLQESVRDGLLTYREAGSIMGSCFRTEEW